MSASHTCDLAQLQMSRHLSPKYPSGHVVVQFACKEWMQAVSKEREINIKQC